MGLVPCPYLAVTFENKERLFANLVVAPCAGATRFQVEERNASLICLGARRSAATSKLFQLNSRGDGDKRDLIWMEGRLSMGARCDREQREEKVRQFHSVSRVGLDGESRIYREISPANVHPRAEHVGSGGVRCFFAVDAALRRRNE